MTTTLVTGFTPFDGRDVNASWIAARSLDTHDFVQTVEIPVVWSAPARVLHQICADACPEVIISMGEGREGWFDIETVARNTRKERADNNGTFPEGRPVIPRGHATLEASFDARRLHEKLIRADFPVRVSRDAGGFLCEETLYLLETLKASHSVLKTVVFVHLPPWGTRLERESREATCDENLLAEFSQRLLEAVLDLHREAHETASLD